MKNNVLFLPSNFFDFSGIFFADIFSGIDFAWEALPKINNYITDAFKTGKVKASYRKNVFIGEGTIIESGALIKGPAIIGKNCFIGHTAYLRENCVLGDNVHVGHGSEIKNSIILSKTTVAHLNYVGDSIVGGSVNIGGGAKLANFRFDGKSIGIKTKEGLIDTGLKKFGSIVGDGSKIGVNAVLNPGTILGKNCIVYPLVSVIGTHQEGKTIK